MQFEITTSKNSYRYASDENGILPQFNLGLHYHIEYELLYIVRGEGEFRIQQKTYRIQPNSFLIIKPGEYHCITLTSGKRYERIVIHFKDDDLSDSIREHITSLGNMYIIPGTRLSDELLRMNYYCTDFSENIRENVIDSQIQIILSYMCNIVGQLQMANYVVEGAERIISYIDANLISIRSIEDICKNVHMSRSTVQKLIRVHLQTPVMSYVRTQKCMLARNLLRKGHSSMDVCFQCGYDDYSSFYRAYKNVFNEPPSMAKSEIGKHT